MCNFRKDGRHAYVNFRPALAKINSAWEDAEEFERYLDICADEAAQYKTNVN